MRPVDHGIFARGVRYSTIPISQLQKCTTFFLWVRGRSTVTDSTSSCRPLFYQVLQPFNTVNPLSVVIMDSASIHDLQSCVDLIENAGSSVIVCPHTRQTYIHLNQFFFCTVKSILKEL